MQEQMQSANPEMPPENNFPEWDCRLLLTAAIAFVFGYMLLPGVGHLFFDRSSPAQLIFGVGGMFAALGSLILTVRRMAGSWRAAAEMMDFKKLPIKNIFMAWPLAMIIAIAGTAMTLLWTWAANRVGIEFALPPTTSIMRNGSVWQIAALSISAVAVAPLFEEIFFRKALCGALARCCGYIPAVVITAVLFAAMHFSWQQLPGLIFFSVVWQWFYRRSQSLWSAVILHFINNLFSVAMLLAARCWGMDM